MDARESPSVSDTAISTIVLPEEVAKTSTSQTSYGVVVSFDQTYVRSRDFMLRLVHVVCVIIYLILIVTGGTSDCDYLCLPFALHLRILVFSCVLSLLVNLLAIGLRLSSTVTMFPIDWNIFDIVVYGTLALLLFVGSVLVAIDVSSYRGRSHIVPLATARHYITAVVIGFCCTLLHCAKSSFSCHDRRLHSGGGGGADSSRSHAILLSQQSSSSVTTTTTETVPIV